MALPYGISAAGHEAVVLFFVLSGYLVGGSVLRALERKQWDWRDYLLRRFARLWVVLLPTLLLCLFWDHLGIYLGHAPRLYAGLVPNHMVGNISSSLGSRIFFANAFFLQGILTPMLGTDGALWSLANEFWYYVMFPLGLLAVVRGTPWRLRVLYGVLLGGVAWFVGRGILNSFPIWLAGAALTRVRPPSLSAVVGSLIRWVSGCVMFASLFVLSRRSIGPGVTGDYVLAGLSVVYLWFLLSDRDRFPKNAIRVRGTRDLARFSYTLYAAHTPLLVLLASFIVGDTRWIPTQRTLLEGVGLIVVALAYSYGLALVTEFRTDDLRRALERAFGMRHTVAGLPSDPLFEDKTGGVAAK